MNLYTHDLSLFDFANFSDPIVDPIGLSHYQDRDLRRSLSSASSSIARHDSLDDVGPSDNYGDGVKGEAVSEKPKSPPRHRHDGTSPLPLGMDWSLPPRKWEGRDSIWPQDPHAGWSYCVTIPSWTFLPNSRGSDPIVFYQVQVGVQSPERITTTRGILRRFSDFLSLLSELKKTFSNKTLPRAPPKRILRTKNRALLEERRYSLEDWIEKLLSDIDISRSAPVATFLELEAAARLSFDDMNQENSYANHSSGMVSSLLFHTNSNISVLAGSSWIASGHGDDSQDEISELGTPRHERNYSLDLGMNASTSELNINDLLETSAKDDKLKLKNILGNLDRFSWRKMLAQREKGITGKDKLAKTMPKEQDFIGDGTKSLPELTYQRLDGHVQTLSTDNVGSDVSSIRASDMSNLGMNELFGDDSFDLSEGAQTPRSDVAVSSDLHFPKDLLVALPVEQRHKLNRVLNTIQQRLNTAKTDMEDLIARLNQEIAVRQFLTMKVKDLEVDLETTRTNCKDNMQQAIMTERERFTQMQWDVGDLQRKCLEMELKLNHEQDEKARTESAKASLMQENEKLLHQLDLAREELAILCRDHEELELKSKADVKLLVKEVKSLRSSQSELKQDLGRLMKEKLEVEHVLQKEKQRMEHVTAVNSKLLHECEILHNRLQECSVSFLVEEEDKLIVETSSTSDAIDLLTTSDNRIGLLLAEAQLLAQDIQSSDARSEETYNMNDINGSNNELGKMLTDIFIDNARLRMQINSVIRYVLHTNVNSDKEEEEEESPLRRTVLSKFLER